MKRKYITFIGWTFIVLAAVLVVGLLVDRKKALVSGEISTSPTKICFVKAAPAATGTDKYTLDITITGATATGSLALLPSEKDKKTGDFTGTMDKANVNGMIDTNIMGNLGTFWWKTTAEGMTNTEELRIKFADPMSGQARAFIGFGEMKDRGDGTYIYADPAAIDYSLELAEVNCGSDTGRVVDDMVLPPPPMDYTKPLDTKYITAASVWPAKVETKSTGKLTCKAPKDIQGSMYCVDKESEGAAGSTYTTYTYKTMVGKTFASTTFILRTVQCMNYDEPQQSECKNEQASFDVDMLADGLIHQLVK